MNVVDFISILWYYMCIYKNGDIFMIQPEIRFKGFTDEWSTSVLGDVLKIPAKIEANVKSNSDLLTVKLHGGGVHQMSSNKVLSIGATKYYIRKAGQLIYGKQNFFNGSMAIIPLELDGKASSGDVPVFDITGADSIFLYQKISQPSFYERTKDLASGTGSKRLHEKTVQRLPIQLPTLPEQQKIGALFSKYDAIISLREQKLEELNALKKGLLQQMFDDDSKPQVRFSGFNDEWVERKLGDVAEIAGGRTPSTSDAKYWDGGKDWYTPSDLTIVRRRTRGSARTISEFASLRIWPQNTLLLSTRAGIGKMTILTKEASINQGLKAICLNENFDPDFMYTYQPSISKQANRLASGSTFTEISTHDVNKIKLNFPSLPEQQKIGAFFEKLDAEIAAEQTKINLLKEQKKGLLERVL